MFRGRRSPPHQYVFAGARGHGRPAEFPVDPVAQRLRRRRLAVDEVGGVQWCGPAQSLDGLYGVRVRREGGHIDHFGADRYVGAVQLRAASPAGQVPRAGALSCEADDDHGVARIRQEPAQVSNDPAPVAMPDAETTTEGTSDRSSRRDCWSERTAVKGSRSRTADP